MKKIRGGGGGGGAMFEPKTLSRYLKEKKKKKKRNKIKIDQDGIRTHDIRVKRPAFLSSRLNTIAITKYEWEIKIFQRQFFEEKNMIFFLHFHQIVLYELIKVSSLYL